MLKHKIINEIILILVFLIITIINIFSITCAYERYTFNYTINIAEIEIIE